MLLTALEMLTRLCALLERDTVQRLGGFLGSAAWCLGARRQAVSHNLQLALGISGPERRKLAHRAYQHLGRSWLSVLLPHERHPVRIANPLWLRHLAGQGGAVVISAHLGDWEAAGRALASVLPPGGLLAYAEDQGPLDGFLQSRRRAAGMRMTTVRNDGHGALRAIRALRSGAWAGLVADQGPRPATGKAVWFFNQPTYGEHGAMVLARAARVPVVPLLCVHDRQGQPVLFVGRPWMVHHEQTSLQHALDCCAAAIQHFPGQYFWHHRRFKYVSELGPRSHARWRTGLKLWLMSPAANDGCAPEPAL